MNLRQKHASLMAEARKLLAQYDEAESVPEDVSTKINTLLGQADEIKVRIDLDESIAAGESLYAGDTSTPPKAASHGWRPSAPGEGVMDIDEKAWREMEIVTPFGAQKMRYHVPLAVQAEGYAGAFEGYLRRGKDLTSSRDMKTLSVGVDSAGGFTAPEQYMEELLKKRATMATIRAVARRVTTSSDLIKWPKVVYTTDDKYTSPVRVTWVGESPATATAHRVTDQSFALESIPINTAMASQAISMQLIEDSAFDITGYSSDLFGEAFALDENDVFLNGSGVSRPMGLLTQVDGAGPASVASGTSAAITTSGDAHEAYRIDKLFYALPSQYRNSARWLYNSTTALAIDALVDAQDRPLIQTLQGGSMQVGVQYVLKGRPVQHDEFVPSIGASTYPIIFGDFSGYLVADRVGFSIQRLDEVYAELGLVVLLARERVGGYCIEPWKLRVMKCAS